MEYVLAFWVPDFIVCLLGQFVAVLAGGFALAGLFWITGYVIHHLLLLLRGGN